ncbi:hypothetical protein PIIN_11182 [Serendipita indica DSM 11827]|uniref:Uncharacterized protein n=1 Tax=Serendipita indica (strain DSM 11827) TaxID=1109443 RepID=G4U0V7_SERID|nr:hypothetical protein PIIN_11182 [Serendipita indica DSM 11827]
MAEKNIFREVLRRQRSLDSDPRAVDMLFLWTPTLYRRKNPGSGTWYRIRQRQPFFSRPSRLFCTEEFKNHKSVLFHSTDSKSNSSHICSTTIAESKSLLPTARKAVIRIVLSFP